MSMAIFYFSGTGNSLVAARAIAGKTKAALISIPEVIKQEKIQIDADTIGIVFPSYLAVLSGLPLIVEQFVKKIANIESRYIFAVCTCGGYECVNALPPLKRLKQIVRTCGGRLSAGFSVRLPMNNLDYGHIPIPINRDQDSIIKIGKIRLDQICDRIIKKKGTRHKAMKALFTFAMTPFYILMRPAVLKTLREKAKEPPDSKLKYSELVPLTDKRFWPKRWSCPQGNVRFWWKSFYI